MSIESCQESESERIEEPIETELLRQSNRDGHEPDRYIGVHDILIVDQDEPTTYKAAISSPESKKWLEAMQAEIQSMYDNQVWDLVDLPPESRAVGSKWFSS
jgi:hypothetical protein